jgi:hypothetical protein
MNIQEYKMLISNLPVRKQSFTTKRKTWEKIENEYLWFKKLNDKLFGLNSELTISRTDIFETIDLKETIIKTIYWGYKGGMRGNHFINIIINIGLIENILNKLRAKEKLTNEDYEWLRQQFKKINGLGISTYSKILYFLDLKFENNPCLILDQRIIKVLKTKKYTEFETLSSLHYSNADIKYLDFLLIVKNLSKILETNGENIEQFLFIFGNNLTD